MKKQNKKKTIPQKSNAELFTKKPGFLCWILWRWDSMQDGHSFCGVDKESALLGHITNTEHSISLDDVSILAREPRSKARKIKEALEI